MGLIEKAGGVSGVFGDNDSPPKPATAIAPASFDINFPALASQGFYTPADRNTKLSLELRSIKRNLLRRLGLRNAAGDRRMIRKSGRQRNLVLVTSTRPAEGKTFCAINLALSLALEDETEVLLVDADTPRPKIRTHFHLPDSRGLTDRLLDPSLPVDSLCARSRQAPLAILPEGTPTGRASDLFASPEAQRLFTELSMASAGRVVLIDAPPVLATTEAIILARHVDEVIFIVEADSTPETGLAAALDELLEANPNVSLLLNRCLIGAGGAYYGAYRDYGDRQEDKAGGAPARPAK